MLTVHGLTRPTIFSKDSTTAQRRVRGMLGSGFMGQYAMASLAGSPSEGRPNPNEWTAFAGAPTTVLSESARRRPIGGIESAATGNRLRRRHADRLVEHDPAMDHASLSASCPGGGTRRGWRRHANCGRRSGLESAVSESHLFAHICGSRMVLIRPNQWPLLLLPPPLAPRRARFVPLVHWVRVIAEFEICSKHMFTNQLFGFGF